MSDITKCPGKDCPLKDTCWRYVSTPDRWQSYFVEPPFDSTTKECESYWSTDED